MNLLEPGDNYRLDRADDDTITATLRVRRCHDNHSTFDALPHVWRTERVHTVQRLFPGEYEHQRVVAASIAAYTVEGHDIWLCWGGPPETQGWATCS